MKLARRNGDYLIGKSFHRYGPIIFSDFFLLLVRAKEIPNAHISILLCSAGAADAERFSLCPVVPMSVLMSRDNMDQEASPFPGQHGLVRRAYTCAPVGAS